MTLPSLIQQEIEKSGGFISFARFMEQALYAPEQGYYNVKSQKFGQKGDFLTAPEMSPLFAKCIARQCSQVLTEIGSGDILEIGAGSGIFAKDLLLELESLGQLPKNYFILEISSELCLQQKIFLEKNCPHLILHFKWIDSLPENFTGIIFANEFLDALPVHCFKLEKNKIYEKSVTVEKNNFTWHLTSPSKALSEKIEILQKEILFPEEYESEMNLSVPNWIEKLGKSLQKGMILFLDYGYGRREYYHPDRAQGTLMCFYQHRSHDNPFVNVGMQDITAHVDFSFLAESAFENELVLSGYTTQAAFLLSCGILDIAQKMQQDPLDQYQRNQAIKILTLPSQMGELIKAMALTKGMDANLMGFTLHDRCRDLL